MSIDERTHALLEGPNFAHVATSMPDGAPHVAAVWIDIDAEDRLLFIKEESSVAIKNLRRDPRLAVSIVNVEDPYEEAHARGRVLEIRGHQEAAKLLLDLGRAYTGPAYQVTTSPALQLVVAEIEVAGSSHITYVEHTPPGARLQLLRDRSDA